MDFTDWFAPGFFAISAPKGKSGVFARGNGLREEFVPQTVKEGVRVVVQGWRKWRGSTAFSNARGPSYVSSQKPLIRQILAARVGR